MLIAALCIMGVILPVEMECPSTLVFNYIPEYNLCFSGGEIDSVDKDGNTPLHIAAYYGHEHLISTLIASGADCTKLARLPLCKNALTETTTGCKVANIVQSVNLKGKASTACCPFTWLPWTLTLTAARSCCPQVSWPGTAEILSCWDAQLCVRSLLIPYPYLIHIHIYSGQGFYCRWYYYTLPSKIDKIRRPIWSFFAEYQRAKYWVERRQINYSVVIFPNWSWLRPLLHSGYTQFWTPPPQPVVQTDCFIVKEVEFISATWIIFERIYDVICMVVGFNSCHCLSPPCGCWE